ncbi:hypothetical protein F5Y19DRAFT_337792 [Xylariaceae sp. FL1651]|nr:hypothetical protein F5Y19DRAFT_337792 [Xylariaceae sp. FL1651]
MSSPTNKPQIASQPRTYNDYTVGWVCALPKEQTAAIAMLDQRHPKLPKPANDPNTYTLGSIGDHNIVITCLPSGKYANVPATAVAIHMVHAFPSIKFGLMVGIGGGIPPKVRLGDVVVGIPMGQHPGVVQWDLGKQERGGFTRTGSLNNPPLLLLSAISELRTQHGLEESKMQSYLSEMVAKYPKLASTYLRSEFLQDVLFKPTYDHNETIPEPTDSLSDNGMGMEEEEDSCRYCDRTQVVPRKPRDMRVHYGLIASGNSVIKNATFRDALRRNLGKDVLCVEMEAAGLMDNFPCLVIRGICDYADSHKNKIWQEHAAAVAAAFAKELLGYIQPSDVDREKAVIDILDHIRIAVDSIKDDTRYTSSRLHEKGDLEILDWLVPPEYDYGPQQTDNFRRREPGTGQWLLDSEEYQGWIQQPGRTLFCPGIPGAGKTILTSIVVDDLENRFRNKTTTVIVYIYCNYKRQSEQTVENMLSSLLKQFAQCQPSLPRSLKELYERHKTKRTRPSLNEISMSLESATAKNSGSFIVVDALDECRASDSCRSSFLSAIFHLQLKTRVNIFATSRIVPEITERFENSLVVEIRATEGDIRRYLQGHKAELPELVIDEPSLQDEIINSIAEAVDGMFLLATLHLGSLRGKDTPKAIRTTLRNMARGSNATKENIYELAYKSATDRIRGQLKEQAERAKQVISWIVCTKRPLTTLELLHALAVEIDKPGLDQDNIPRIKDVVSVCGGLVTVDEQSSIVRLVHYTAQDYFQQTKNDWFPDAQYYIAATCTTYLSFHEFKTGYAKTDEKFEERLKSHYFYAYAARNWGYHSREVPDCQNILSFLRKPAQVEASSQLLLMADDRYKWPGYSQRTPKNMTGLHLAAYFGLEVIARLLDEFDPDTRDDDGRTPLSWAAERGHEAIVQQLLATGKSTPTREIITAGRRCRGRQGAGTRP